jgi:phosphohistidine phosphatase
MHGMAKTLVIIRHGKSTWDYEGISDFDRPLKEVGISNTQLVAQKIKSLGIFPDLVLSSPANRALHTALIVAREIHYPLNQIAINTTLYTEFEKDILELIKNTDNQTNTLFIFGHNPVFTDLPNYFLKAQIDNLPTSGAAILQFEASTWKEISKKNLLSEVTIFPKSL